MQSAPTGRNDNLLTASLTDSSNRNYVGLAIGATRLSGPVQVLWNYGDTIYFENVTLENAVQFSAPGFPVADVSASLGRIRQPDRARDVNGPPGSTGDDMNAWDLVDARAYPVRPGVYFLEWDLPNLDSKVVLQVRAGFGGDRIFPALSLIHI